MSRLTDATKLLLHGWNAFDNTDPAYSPPDVGPISTERPGRNRYRLFNERTIVTAIYTRMAIDLASVPIRHVRLDESRQYKEDITSGFNNCLTVEPNIDQGPRQFIQDAAQSLFDWGVIAIVPVNTTASPLITGGYDINSMRVGRIINWFPKHITARVYNEKTGMQQDVLLPKSTVAIVENPLYSVMNEPNSTLQRLLRTLSLVDAVDSKAASNQLDVIIQLPYVIKTETRRQQAETRRKELEYQLQNSEYGVAYTDGTEKVIQLNRPAENNLLGRIEFLTAMLYGQLGITVEVMNGTADETAMINYYNRSIEPILGALVQAMIRSFLTTTGRSQGQSILYIKDPFKLVPVKDLAEIADKMRRNEILTGNNMRSVIGFPPIDDPNANKLQNPNIPAAYSEQPKNGIALTRPQLPPKTSDQLVRAIPSGSATDQGEPSQNGTHP